MKKKLMVVLGCSFVAVVALAADDYIAAIDVDAGVIKMLYGPSSETNFISAQNSSWVNVYISQAEYTNAFNDIKNKPASQQSVNYLPAAKVAAAVAAAADEEADYLLWVNAKLKAAMVVLAKEINTLRKLAGQAKYTKEEWQAKLKDNM